MRASVTVVLLLLACDSPGTTSSGPVDCAVTPNAPACQDTAVSSDTTPDLVEVDDTAVDTSTPDTGPLPDATPTNTYYAVIVDDDGFFQNHRPNASPCATSTIGAHGADIDAVGLFESDGTTLVSYFDIVDAKLGTTCAMSAPYNDPSQSRGAPNGTLATNFVSLGGGALIGEFTDGVAIFAGDVVIVYEVGTRCGGSTNCGGLDEAYHVYIAHDLDCLNRDRSTCQVRVTNVGGAKGEAKLTLTGF